MYRPLLAVVPFVVLAACSAPPQAAPAPATTAPTSTTAATKTFSTSDKQLMQANACTFLSSGDTEAAAAKKLVDRYKPLSIDEAQQVVDDAQAADGLCPK